MDELVILYDAPKSIKHDLFKLAKIRNCLIYHLSCKVYPVVRSGFISEVSNIQSGFENHTF